MVNCLVTGGAGFIGSHLVDGLVEQQYGVRVLDNFSTGKHENLEKSGDRIEVVEGDFRDINIVRECMRGIRYVFHQGALPSVPRSVDDPATTNDVNISGTLNVLIAARDEGVEKFVFASSSSVYGNSPVSPKSEFLPMTPLSPYALSKVTGEEYCRLFYELYGLPTIALRYFNVFGPRQDPSSPYSAVIPRFITAFLKNEAPTIYGDGSQTRDFTFVSNVVEANLLAMKSDVNGRKMNVACGHETSVNTLAEIIGKLLDNDTPPDYTDARPGDVKVSIADIDLARKLLGYRIIVSLEEGLQQTITWFQHVFKG